MIGEQCVLRMMQAQLARETTCMQRSYALHDGRSICVGTERFRAPEALFRPSLLDVESPGIAELAFRCVQVCALSNPPPAISL